MIAWMPRRVLLLNTDLQIGGTPTVVRELAIRLRRRTRAQIEVACLAGWGPVADELAASGVPVTALNARGPNDLLAIARLARLVRGRGFDTVMSFLIHANAAAAAVSLICPRVRFLQSIQSTMPDPRWHWALQRIVHHAADQLFVPSESIARALCRWSGVPSAKIAVIPNAICPGDFPPSPIPPRDPRPYPIGFIGRLEPVKRVGDLVEAVRLLDGLVHLHVFGYGSEAAAIAQAVRQLGIQQWITLHGPVQRPREALQQIGLLALPSSTEGFGLVLIEAMAARVPVIGTDVPGIRDVVRHGQTGLLVKPLCPSALAGAIRLIIEDRALRQELVERAAAEVRHRFTWDTVLELYRELLGL